MTLAFRPWWSLALMGLAAGLWVVAAACSTSPTPTTIPPPDPRELLDRAAEALRGVTSVHYTLSHEEGGTDLGGGLELRAVEGDAAFPARARLSARAVLREFNVNMEIGILQVEDQAFMRGPIGQQWRQVSPGSLPFLFADMNNSVADALEAAEGVSLTGVGEVDGIPVYRLKGRVPTEALRGLVPGALSGDLLDLEVQIGQDDALPRTVRLVGMLLSQDPPDMVRVLQLSNFNAPVTIEPPDVE